MSASVTWQPGWQLPTAPSGPSVPDTALVYGGEPLVFGGDYLVFGTPSTTTGSPAITWGPGWVIPAS